METSLFITYILIPFVNIILSLHKNRNPIGWFILGFILGPLSIILLIVLPRNIDYIDEKIMLNRITKKCPFCAERIKKEAIICRYCGSDLTEYINFNLIYEQQSSQFKSGQKNC